MEFKSCDCNAPPAEYAASSTRSDVKGEEKEQGNPDPPLGLPEGEAS